VPQSLRYRRAAVRDLAWLVLDGALVLPAATQPLAVVALTAAERAEFLDLLQQWDAAADDAWLGAVDPRLRLGLYSERLVGAWLSHCRQIRLLAMNWPLRTNRITLGEADFLVERRIDGVDQRQLWETACKFYLGVPDRGWLGPGLNDSLAAKLSRVRGHQLRLIHQAGFEAAWGNGWSARAWMTGWLLSPAGLPDDAAPDPPLRLSSRSRVPAVWAEAGSASLAAATRHARELGVMQWWLLPKRRWLRPVYDDEPVPTIFAELADAAAFLDRTAQAEEGRGSSRGSSRGSPRQPAHDDGPRPLMLAGIRWLHSPDPVADADREVKAPGRAGDDATTDTTHCRTRQVVAEVMRLMLVPEGWSRRALATAPAPDIDAAGGER
jgi:hypothetical protein